MCFLTTLPVIEFSHPGYFLANSADIVPIIKRPTRASRSRDPGEIYLGLTNRHRRGSARYTSCGACEHSIVFVLEIGLDV